MHIIDLKLKNFRNYKYLELLFSPHINVFWGNNGQGKTNLLEAIHVLCTGRSFRTHRMQDLILQGENHFYIEARCIKDNVIHSLKIYYDGAEKKIIYNDKTYSHFSSLLGIFPCVLLSPDDLLLINSSPAERRRFLDLHIAQIDPLYLFYLSRYYKAMKQRNELLRSKEKETLGAWEQVMAPAASYLIAKRRDATTLLSASAGHWMRLFSEDEELGLAYHSLLQEVKADELSNQLSAYWQTTRHKDMHYATTMAGPHRDDLTILLSGKEAKHFSSEGQKRSCIASLRFGQWEHMKKWTDTPPLLAIDDFGIQLDATRQNRLQEQITHFGQVFLTSPHAIDCFSTASTFQAFHVQQGNILNALTRN